MKLTIIGQIKQRNTGLGKAINDLVDFVATNTGNNLQLVDITNNLLFPLSLIKLFFKKTDVYYFTPSGSVLGNVRDSIILLLLILKNEPIVLHFHNSNFGNTVNKYKLLLKLNRLIYNKVDKIILLGQKQITMFDQLNIPKSKFVIVRNGIDEDLFIDSETLNKKHKRFRKKIVYFSNFVPEKGYDLVLELAKRFQYNEEFEFIFSGKFFDELLENEFVSTIEKMANVTYYNGVYGEDKRDLLFDTNIFILPSRYPDETLPISMLEAMASGNFIFITNIGVVEEVVNSTSSIFIEDRDLEKLSKQILEISANLSEIDYKIEELREGFANSQSLKNVMKVIESVDDV